MFLSKFRTIVKNHPFYPHTSHTSLHFFSTGTTGKSRIVPTADYLLNEHQFSLETASKVSSIMPHLNYPERADSVLSFLKEIGLSVTQLERVVLTLPKLLCSELQSSIKPKINIFQDIGFSPTDIAEIISIYPRVTMKHSDASINQLKRSLLGLRKVLGLNLSVSLLSKCSQVLNSDLRRCYLPNIEYLQRLGISSSQILLVSSNFPRDLFINPAKFKEVSRKVEEMGLSRESKMFVHALHTLIGMSTETWERKQDVFRRIGFSEHDILSVFRRVPVVFSVSEKKIKDMTEILLGSGLYDLSFLVSQTQIFIFSIERTIKPRLQVLEVLKRNKLLNVKLNTYAYKISEEEFINRLVLPFCDKCPELLEMVSEGKLKLRIAERPESSQF